MSLRAVLTRNIPAALSMVGVMVAASTAQATLFSFASDVNTNSYTFAGTAGTGGSFSITDFSRPNTFNLLVDDNNGTRPTLSIPVEFHAALTANTGTSTLIAGSLFRHTYRVTGTFSLNDMMGNALLTVTLGPTNGGILTVPGTQTAWGTSGAVLGADSYADVTYTASAAFITALGGTAAAAGYGVTVGASTGIDDLGFTMSVINSGSVGAGVAIDATTKAPTAAWRSESSFSGSAFIPTPASAALMGMGVLVMGARRRR
jgi:hypothetical protein